MNKLLTSLLVTVSLAVTLFANAQDYDDIYYDSNKPSKTVGKTAAPQAPAQPVVQKPAVIPVEDLVIDPQKIFTHQGPVTQAAAKQPTIPAPDVPFKVVQSFSQMGGEEQHAFVEFLLGKDNSPHEDGSNYYSMEPYHDYRDRTVALQDLQEAWTLLTPQQRTQKLQAWDDEVRADNEEMDRQGSTYRRQTLDELAKEANKPIAAASTPGHLMDRVPTPVAADLKGVTIPEKKESWWKRTKNNIRNFFSPKKDKKDEDKDVKAEEKPAEPPVAQDKPADQPLALQAQKPLVGPEKEPQAPKGSLEEIWQEMVSQSSAAKQQDPAGNVLQALDAQVAAAQPEQPNVVAQNVGKKGPMSHLQLDFDNPFAGNKAPVAKKQTPRKQVSASATTGQQGHLLPGVGLTSDVAGAASSGSGKFPVSLEFSQDGKLTPTPTATDLLASKKTTDTSNMKEKVEGVVYAPWAQKLKELTGKINHTVRPVPNASSTKKMEPIMQQLHKDIHDRLQSHELLKGYYVAVINIDAVGAEGLTKLYKFLNLSLSDKESMDAPKEFGKGVQEPFFVMLDNGDKMEIAFTNDIHLRIYKHKKMDLYRLSCGEQACTADNKQVAGNKNNAATVHIIR